MTEPTAHDPQHVADVLETGLDLLRYAVSRFHAAELHFGHGTDNALDEARLLVAHAIDLPLDTPDLLFQARLLPSERLRVLALIEERIERRCPAPYLTGEAWFAGLPFQVDERVIVPRSPVAELIETGFAPWVEAPEQVSAVLDMCTGSGCIAIACAYAFPNAQVDALDLSEDALEVATANVLAHDLSARVRVLQSNLFAALGDERYQLIVCNPPYVGAEELRELPEEYAAEPSMALAGGEDGLMLVEQILRQAARHLTSDGVLVLELGNSAPTAIDRWPELPFTWLEFERGGHGVCLLREPELRHFADASPGVH
ncbi:MAG: 50S ribosomal protein L3 N(5)-glutamine methyltransferase [Pseudomonadota bacterium]